jgi:hypothetical protein
MSDARPLLTAFLLFGRGRLLRNAEAISVRLILAPSILAIRPHGEWIDRQQSTKSDVS